MPSPARELSLVIPGQGLFTTNVVESGQPMSQHLSGQASGQFDGSDSATSYEVEKSEGLPRLFHGGTPRLQPGDVIEPHEPNYVDDCAICEAHRKGAEVAVHGQVIDPANHAPDFVFATSDREYGRFYASKFPHGDLYVVEPIGEVTASECDPFPTWMARSFRVRSVYERCVELTMAQRRRLLKRWPDEMWKAS